MAEETLDKYNKTIEIPRSRMFGNPMPGSNRSPQLAWCIYKANPRISVFVNGPQDTAGKGIISAPMDPTTMMVLLDDMLKIADGPNGVSDKMTCFTTSRETGNGAGAPEKILLSEVHYGKDENGIVWIGLVAKDQPKIRFPFRMSDWHELYFGDQPATEASASVARAKGAIGLLKKAYPIYIADIELSVLNRMAAEQRQQPRSKSAGSSFDDDITF